MRRHTPDAFDIAVQKGNIWLKDIEEAGKLRSRFQAYSVLRCVLHALRDCAPAPEAVKFAAQLPLLIKGVFYDGWKIAPKPERLTLAEFDARIKGVLREENGVEPKNALKSVLFALRRHVSPAVLEHFQLVLPREVHAAVKQGLLEVAAREAAEKLGSAQWQEADMGGPFGE